jgi:hypothetical protein
MPYLFYIHVIGLFLSRDRFYILSIKAHVILLTPTSYSRRTAFARDVEILLIYFQVVASLPTKVYWHYLAKTVQDYCDQLAGLGCFQC